jgi:hypothetical protein
MMIVFLLSLLLFSTHTMAIEPAPVAISLEQDHSILLTKQVQLSQQENKITLRCANQMLTFEQDGMGDIKSSVQRYDYPHFSLLTLQSADTPGKLWLWRCKYIPSSGEIGG